MRETHYGIRRSPEELARKQADILAYLANCARLNKVCPSMRDLAATFRLSTSTVLDMLFALRKQGRITWKLVNAPQLGGRIRVVRITATGEQTAPPKKRAVPAAGAASMELEKAKTRLRQLNRIVFNAEVTDGASGLGFINVDGKLLTPEEVIQRAAA